MFVVFVNTFEILNRFVKTIYRNILKRFCGTHQKAFFYTHFYVSKCYCSIYKHAYYHLILMWNLMRECPFIANIAWYFSRVYSFIIHVVENAF